MTAVNGPYDAALVATAAVFDTVFGREMVYLPKAGGTRTIMGIIIPQAPGEIPGSLGGVTEFHLVSVPNSAVTGIALTELDTGGNDKLRIEWPVGGSTADRPIMGVEKQDQGRLLLRLA